MERFLQRMSASVSSSMQGADEKALESKRYKELMKNVTVRRQLYKYKGAACPFRQLHCLELSSMSNARHPHVRRSVSSVACTVAGVCCSRCSPLFPELDFVWCYPMR